MLLDVERSNETLSRKSARSSYIRNLHGNLVKDVRAAGVNPQAECLDRVTPTAQTHLEHVFSTGSYISHYISLRTSRTAVKSELISRTCNQIIQD